MLAPDDRDALGIALEMVVMGSLSSGLSTTLIMSCSCERSESTAESRGFSCTSSAG
jgi:hypothetical protein